MQRLSGLDLKLLRVGLGQKQFQVAAALGITPSQLCAIENGRRPITEREAAGIAQAIRDLSEATARVADDRAA